MVDYLINLSKNLSPADREASVSVEIEDLMTDVAGALRTETCLHQHLHRLSSLNGYLSLDVYRASN